MIVQGHQQVFATLQSGERVIGAEGSDPRSFAHGHEVPNQTIIYPSEGAFFVSSPTAIIKGARSPNAAKLFAQFMISPAAQAMIAAGGIHASRPDVPPPPGLPPLSAIKALPIDLDYVEEHNRDVKARFNEIFQ
jgi:iron(III) transport system substrate-binding protein